MKYHLLLYNVAFTILLCSIQLKTIAQEALPPTEPLASNDVGQWESEEQKRSLQDELERLESLRNVSFGYEPRVLENLWVSPLNLQSTEDVDALLSELVSPNSLAFDKVGESSYVIFRPEPVAALRKDPGGNAVAAPVLGKQVQVPVDITLSGLVTDSKNEPLPGVNIIVKGTTLGTTTDAQGRYTLTVPDGTETLVYSFIGYVTQEVAINGRSTINVVLVEDMRQLNEVVVVGYGTQKKVNLTGSISSVDAEELKTVTTASIPMAMMGRASGLFVKNTTGEPGDENATTFNIRGFGGTPLIIIDGMPASKEELNHLDPNDVAEFNVLKDAAAGAIYGARAGNGVILITTKRGEVGAMDITVSSDFSAQYFPTYSGEDLPSAAQYAAMENVGSINAGRAPVWSEEEIQKFKDGTDPQYPNNDWSELVLRKFAPSMKHNINIRGGTEKIKYFVSGGYFYQEGQIKANEIKLHRYNLRSNVDVALTEKLDLGVNLAFTNQNHSTPWKTFNRSGKTGPGVGGRMRRAPYFHASFPDPTKLPAGDVPNVLMYGDNYGYRFEKKLKADAKLSLAYELPFGLKAKAFMQVFRNDIFFKERALKNELYDYNWGTGEYTLAGYTNPRSTLEQRMDIGNAFNQQYFLSWDRNFDDHTFGATVVYEILSSDMEWFSASRRDYVFDIDYLFAGPDLDKDNNGSGGRDGRKGVVSRINYDYKGKYLIEVNGRYDASPRFPTETRWGFFPSASVGWRISEEPFMQDFVDSNVLSNLKIRASHGRLGYDQTGNWQYLALYSQRGGYIFNGNNDEFTSGLNADALPNPTITWEKIDITDVGLDFELWSGKLYGSVDYFYRLRSDVLGSRIRSLPDVVGAQLPNVNYAEYDDRGWDFSLGWHNSVGELQYNLGGNISFTREKTLVRDQTPFPNKEAKRRNNVVGQWTDLAWGYKTDGLFKSREEIDQWADIDGKNNASVYPGDIKYVDYNGDGRISSADEVIIGRGRFPKYTYGINLDLKWKNFNVSMLWQGAGAFDIDVGRARDMLQPFLGGGYNPLMTMYEDSYVPDTPENVWMTPNTENPRWPRFGDNPYNRRHRNYRWDSDFWIIKGDYIRLKALQIGYSLPSALTESLGVNSCKFYVSGYNLLTFSDPLLKKLMDPETNTGQGSSIGKNYPVTATLNAGFVLNF